MKDVMPEAPAVPARPDDHADLQIEAQPETEPEANLSVEERRAELWKQAHWIAQLPNILAVVGGDMATRGFAGSTVLPQLIYLDVTSRLLPRPASLAVKGESSAGKNTQIVFALRYFPESAYMVRTDTSPKALYYSQESFVHRTLVVLEADALDGGTFAHAVRTLLSEGRLSYEFTDFEARSTVLVEKEGPTGLITTTTRPRLDGELETRILSAWVPDTAEQTGAVMKAIAAKYAGIEVPPVDPGWIAFQQWLELGDRDVVVPFAPELVALVPPVTVRLRRDFEAVLTRTSAHALLHQVSRDRDPRGRIIATIDDYAGAHRLIAEPLSEVVEQTVSSKVRETVEALDVLIERTGNGFPQTINDVGHELGLHRSSASRRIGEALDAGFIEEVAGQSGRQVKRFRLGEPMPEDRKLLPSSDELGAACRRARTSE